MRRTVLAGSVRADEANDARLEIDGERLESDDAWIALRQLTRADERHEEGKREAYACHYRYVVGGEKVAVRVEQTPESIASH